MSLGGKKTKGKNFRATETDLEDRLPFGSEQWVGLASAYNDQLPSGWPARDGDSLKQKFMALKNKRKPTGDPDCPSEMKRAKIAFRQIEARCAVSTLHEDESDVAESVGHVTEEVQDIESSDARSDTSLVDTNSVLELDSSANESESLNLEVLSPTQTNVAAGSGTAIPASRCPPAPLTATSRAGLSPNELARLSCRVSRRPSTHDIGNMTTYLSYTTQRRIRLDKMMDKLASEASLSPKKCDDPTLFGLLMMMDERQSAREAELRREREEREAAREERERQFRLELAQSQRSRDEHNQQVMLLVMAKLFGVQPTMNGTEN
ncbi:hypothetical protein PC119_g1740 [Phytophthora cactorum]|uniref:DUF6818 domain-containing protein n=1 Tax=Phytophthora cactorum TaxID=29920 RepID=A0A8T0ZVN1_9STRA|nr:hypothetical protein PC113_g2267 [Phytophthora cactorum]KAG3039960.1 hypothetical protein PC119_g1740 [Phytophthora cactorum]KAG3201399.1 hypothetical protein PC128_g3956 [Phytophthora cactorum]